MSSSFFSIECLVIAVLLILLYETDIFFPISNSFFGHLDEFKSFFSKYGKVVEHEIIRDHATKRPRGFGFIVFDSDKVVDNLLKNGNMIDMAGSQVSYVQWFLIKMGVHGNDSILYREAHQSFTLKCSHYRNNSIAIFFFSVSYFFSISLLLYLLFL